jgi:hypothetical protein
MNPESFVRMLEEMMDLKIQQQAESTMKVPPELSSVLAAKRETDRRRLEQIRQELIRGLHGMQ